MRPPVLPFLRGALFVALTLSVFLPTSLAQQLDREKLLQAQEREELGLESRAPAASPARPASPGARAVAPGSYALRGGGLDNVLFVPESTDDRVLVLDAETGDVLDPMFIVDSDNLSTPIMAMMNFDGDGVFVSDQLGDGIFEYDLDGNFVGLFAPAGGINEDILNNVRGFAISPDGTQLWVTVASGANAGAIAAFDTDGNSLGNFIEPGTGGLSSPWSIVIRKSDILITDSSTDSILRFNLDGTFIDVWNDNVDLNFPQQLNETPFEDEDDILSAGFSTPSGVREYNDDGSVEALYDVITGNRGVWELPNGNLLTTNGSGIHEITRSNTLVRTIAEGSGRFIEANTSTIVGGDPIMLPITFEEAIDYELTDFGGAMSMLVDDPEDATNTVVETVRPDAAECFAGTTVADETGFAEPIPFAPGMTTMSVRVWSPAAGVRVRFKVEKFDDPTVSVESDEFTTVAMEWETLVFDFTDEVPGTAEINFDSEYTKASIFFNFQCDVAPTVTPSDTYYWDDIAFGSGGGEPASVAFEDQNSGGLSVVVASVFVPADGYVAIHNDDLLDGDALGSVIGVSEFLTAGSYTDLSVTLFDVPGLDVPPDTMLMESQTLIAMPHQETSGNMEYNFLTSEGSEDGPFFVNNDPEQGAVIDEAFITIAMPGLISFDPSPLVEELMSGATGTETVTISNGSDQAVMFDFSQYSGEAATQRAPATSDEPALELAKGAADPRGYAQAFGAGGPDAFGYEWIDSNEPGGPAFEPIDIAETGTELTEADFDPEGCTFTPLDEGNALVELPFTFSFYGEDYTSLKVNVNGLINFNADGAEIPCSFTNDPLPDAGTPNGGLIAPLWDDYDANPGGPEGGQIFYETLADGRFVVQWTDIEKFANDTEDNTFQVILSPSGAIKYQYVDLNSSAFSYSIGVENPDGTVGLEVAMGSTYAEEGLAVLIQARPSFVTDVEPATGTIPAGGTADVEVSFSAEGLNAGTYEGVLQVDTDLDADPSSFELPVELVVTGMAACAITPDPVAFDDVIVGFETSEEVTVMNGGTDACALTAASADGPFSVEGFAPTTLGPGQSTTFTVVYTPTEAGDDDGTLTVETDGDALTAALEATALEAPSFSVDPTSLTFTVPTGEVSDAQTLTLTNSGDGAGAFSISVANATARGLSPSFAPVDPIVTVNGPETAALLAQLARSSVVNARSNVSVTARPNANARNTGARSTGAGNAAARFGGSLSGPLSGPLGGDALRGGEPGDLITSASTVASVSGFAQTPDGTLYVSDLNAGTVTQTFVYDEGTLTSTGSFTQPGTAGTNITGVTYYPDGNGGAGALWYLNADLTAGTARFVETDLAGEPTGATVPLALPTGAEVPIGLSYNEATGWFFLVDISGDDILAFNPDGSVVDGYPVPQTCLDDGTGLFGNALDALGSGLDVVVGAPGETRPTRVQVTEFDGTCRGDGSGNDLFTPITATEDAFINAVLRDRAAPNEVMYIGANSDLTVYAVVPAEREDIGSFLIVSPEAGEVAAGGSEEISVAVDATDLAPGTYTAQIVIATNDPSNPELVVDVTVVTTGVANEGEGVPAAFALSQNYPNPFATATTIGYALPEATHVRITVYDAVGRRVAVLVDAEAAAGRYEAEWDTRGVASGVYLYRIEAGEHVATRKMSLVR